MLGPANMRSIPERCVPNQESVTYFSRTPTDTYTQYFVNGTKRKKLDQVETDVGSLIVVSGTQHWQFWQSKLEQAGIASPNVLRIDDYFIDKYGFGWNVVKANFAAMMQRWDVECNDQSGTFLYYTTTKLPGGTVGTAYSQTITVANPNGTPAFSVYAGTLPTGLSLGGSGVLSGTPSVAGTYPFSVGVVDSSGSTIIMPYKVVIAA